MTGYLDDYFLIGHMKLMTCILENNKELISYLLDNQIVEFLMKECLFTFKAEPFNGNITKEVNLPEYKKSFLSKCMQSSSREAAYKLLVAVCENSDESLETVLG